MMKRREFLVRGAGSAMLAAVPFGAAASWTGPLLDDPTAWIGRRFRLADGSRLALAGVERLVGDRHSTQFRLQFTVVAGAAPREGTYALRCGFDEEQLFLQAGREGPVACINRLNARA